MKSTFLQKENPTYLEYTMKFLVKYLVDTHGALKVVKNQTVYSMHKSYNQMYHTHQTHGYQISSLSIDFK